MMKHKTIMTKMIRIFGMVILSKVLWKNMDLTKKICLKMILENVKITLREVMKAE